MTIGIIGYGMVGKAVEFGFNSAKSIICDPRYNITTVNDVCKANPDAIFICVPTPTDGLDYVILRTVLQTIKDSNYSGLVVVKSTVFPQFIEEFDVLYNPEFLSRATANEDFINPPMVIIGGKSSPDSGTGKQARLLQLYRRYSQVNTSKTFLTDIRTAAMVKYTMNSFYATKVTFMNSMNEVAEKMGANWDEVTNILAKHPWMGTHHFQVPGPDGNMGFGGPCLPKDTKALVAEYDVELLKKVLELNAHFRGGDFE